MLHFCGLIEVSLSPVQKEIYMPYGVILQVYFVFYYI
jgi:hypothetical protein